MEEILVFGDEDHLTFRGNAPDLSVRGLCEPNLEDVFALLVSGGEEMDKGERKLIIDQELHET